MRAAVEKAVSELGYIPKKPFPQTAKKTLVVFIPDLLNPYYNETAVGIEERAYEYGLVTTLVDVNRLDQELASVQSWLGTMSVMGCVVFGGVFSDAALVGFARQVPYPVVVINQTVSDTALKTITLDYAKATYQATQHLLQLGHRDIVFLGGSRGSATTEGKVDGIVKATRDAGVVLRDGWIFPGAATIEWGFQAMTSLLSRPGGHTATAAVCSCDLVAFGALHAVRSAGLNVPRDLSVVGFDDIAVACHANPPLTTIAPPKHDMGRRAVELLISTVGPDPIKNYVMLESPLIVRESTAVCIMNSDT